MKEKLKLIIPSVVASMIATICLWVVYKETGKLKAEWWKPVSENSCFVPTVYTGTGVPSVM